MTHNPKVYDLILSDGRYWINCGSLTPPKQWLGHAVMDALAITGGYRVPFLGPLLRNFWAKRRGGLLDDIHHGQNVEGSLID